jgi:ornithine cyclodeaminase/alanine dehydrogenase-like protein (mu-crystallin family)
MTLSLDDSDVRLATRMADIVDAITQVAREEHAGQVHMPPRVNVNRDGTFLRVMPAYLVDSDLIGYKTFHGSMSRGVRYVIVLCRASTGEILAVLDAAYLTAVRTGATSGVATSFLARADSRTVGVIGSGLEAETNLAAVAAVRPIESVRVYSRNAERRAAFAERACETLGVDAQPVDSPIKAIRPADVVVAATNTGTNGPVALQGEWLSQGQHVVSIGSTNPSLREIDATTFDRADRVVFDASPEQVFEESGDLIAVADDELRSRLAAAEVLPSLVARGMQDRSDSAITLFKSVGTAAQDLAAANVIYQISLMKGLGKEIGDLAAPKHFDDPTAK